MPLTPAQSIAAIIAWLSHAAAGRGMRGLLTSALIAAIVNRLRGINQRVTRIAARVAAGTYKPRKITKPRRPSVRNPGTPSPLPCKRGWLLPLVPEAVQAAGQLEFLLRDPAMLALMAAAPASLRRPLRAFCRALGVTPPPILAPPARPRPPRPPRPARAKPPPRPPRPESPAWMRLGPPRKPRTPARLRGPPKPA